MSGSVSQCSRCSPPWLWWGFPPLEAWVFRWGFPTLKLVFSPTGFLLLAAPFVSLQRLFGFLAASAISFASSMVLLFFHSSVAPAPSVGRYVSRNMFGVLYSALPARPRTVT